LIEFLSGAVRWYPESDRIRLSQLDLIRIESLDPFDPIFRKKSWKVRMGFQTREFTEEKDGLVTFAEAGIGGTIRLGGTRSPTCWRKRKRTSRGTTTAPTGSGGEGPRA